MHAIRSEWRAILKTQGQKVFKIYSFYVALPQTRAEKALATTTFTNLFNSTIEIPFAFAVPFAAQCWTSPYSLHS